MRIHIIACRIFERELSYLAAVSDNQIDLTWIGRGLHNTPDKLCAHLISTVDDLYRQLDERELEYRPDAIVLGYGLFTINVATISSFLNHLLNGKLKKKIAEKLDLSE